VIADWLSAFEKAAVVTENGRIVFAHEGIIAPVGL
jgi:hypothetical protein